MLKVSLPQSVTVMPDDLAALVRILGVPVQVEPVDAAAPVATKAGATKKAAAPRTGGNIDPLTGKRKYKPRQPKAAPAAPEAGNPGNEIPDASSSTGAGSAGDPPPPADAAPVKVEKAAAPAKAKPAAAAKPAKAAAPAKAKPAAAAKPAKPAKAAPAESGPAVDKDEVLARFGALIDKDYDQAAKLLEEFGAASFSTIKDTELSAFAAKLEEHGV